MMYQAYNFCNQICDIQRCSNSSSSGNQCCDRNIQPMPTDARAATPIGAATAAPPDAPVTDVKPNVALKPPPPNRTSSKSEVRNWYWFDNETTDGPEETISDELKCTVFSRDMFFKCFLSPAQLLAPERCPNAWQEKVTEAAARFPGLLLSEVVDIGLFA